MCAEKMLVREEELGALRIYSIKELGQGRVYHFGSLSESSSLVLVKDIGTILLTGVGSNIGREDLKLSTRVGYMIAIDDREQSRNEYFVTALFALLEKINKKTKKPWGEAELRIMTRRK